MNRFLLLLFIALSPLEAVAAKPAEKLCTCKCVVKEDGKYTTAEASGKDRVEAGEKLKKKMDKLTCEISPTCTGKCASDTD